MCNPELPAPGLKSKVGDAAEERDTRSVRRDGCAPGVFEDLSRSASNNRDIPQAQCSVRAFRVRHQNVGSVGKPALQVSRETVWQGYLVNFAGPNQLEVQARGIRACEVGAIGEKCR